MEYGTIEKEIKDPLLGKYSKIFTRKENKQNTSHIMEKALVI